MQTQKIENKKIYKRWWHIISRCYNPKDISYKNYGERNIIVCEEWLIYKNFEEWCLHNGYQDSLEIDRIDTNGNYSPENCRFVTRKDNVRNRRNTKKYLFNGEIKSLGEIAEILGINYKLLHQKLNRDKKSLGGFEFKETK